MKLPALSVRRRVTFIMVFIGILGVLLFLIWSPKSSLVVAISMPMSMIATFSVMYFVDVNINIISLAGLALSLIPLITSRMKGITARRSKGRLSRLIGGWLESLEERCYGWVNWPSATGR